MPRKPSFERDEVLERAMNVFWTRGYNRTSMRDLKEATRLNPGSLYAAFTNKEGVFAESVDLYGRGLRREVDALLGGPDEPVEKIRRFFRQLLAGAREDRDSRGCLLVNTLLEAPPEEPELGRRAGEALGYVERRFESLLDQAQREGGIRPTRPPAELARALMATIFGMRVYSRMPDGPAHVEAIVATLLDGVLQPRTD